MESYLISERSTFARARTRRVGDLLQDLLSSRTKWNWRLEAYLNCVGVARFAIKTEIRNAAVVSFDDGEWEECLYCAWSRVQLDWHSGRLLLAAYLYRLGLTPDISASTDFLASFSAI